MRAIVPELISVRKLVPEITRRFYATHGIDKYPAKMVPQLAHHAICQTSKPGQVVFDPFCGCGTVLVEASILGRRSIGIDVNPYAVLLARLKSTVLDTSSFLSHAIRVVEAAHNSQGSRTGDDRDWLKYWFTPKTLEKLLKLERIIRLIPSLRKQDRELLRACLAISVRQCSLADPRSPKPFISKRARIARVGKHFDAFAIFMKTVTRVCDANKDFSLRLSSTSYRARSFLHDSRSIQAARIGSVDAVVTSPPYLTAQDYYRSSKLELAISGVCPPEAASTLGAKIIGSGRGKVLTRNNNHLKGMPTEKLANRLSHRSYVVVAQYLHDMTQMLHGVRKCLSDKGQVCLIIGDSTIEGEYLPVHQWLITQAKLVGFTLFKHEVDIIQKRRLPPKREGHESVIDREHLLFFRKTRVRQVN